MHSLYARFVLWLIRPALGRHHQETWRRNRPGDWTDLLGKHIGPW